jgi:glycine betaine/proline transport system permease protein
MDYLTKHPKLVQFGALIIVFFILMSMTGEYAGYLELRDGFSNKVESGEIHAVASFSDSISMIFRGQLPPQFIRIPEMHFYNPVISSSIGYLLTMLFIIAGLSYKNYHSASKDGRVSASSWFKRNWNKLCIYVFIGIFGGLFIVPTLFTWIFLEPATFSFWDLPSIIHHFARFLMFDFWPVEVYDPDIEEYEFSAMIKEITRGFSRSILFIIDFIREVLLGGIKTIVAFTSWDFISENEWAKWPALPWTVVSATAIMVGYALKGWGLAFLAAFATIYIVVFGAWEPAMMTLSLIFVAAPVSFISGLTLGVLAFKSSATEKVLAPILNITQTMPHFSYLVPVGVFFGIGDHAGCIATIIFATPPMIRLTLLGLKKVSPEVVEAGMMSGCTNYQLLFKVLIPSARFDILIGVNQVIMQCLAMAVISSFIGAKGLGWYLLLAINNLWVGAALQLGICIVLIAVVLDKFSLAWANKQTDYFAELPFMQRHKYSLFFLVILFAGILLAYIGSFIFKGDINYLYQIPYNKGISMADTFQSGIDWFLETFFWSLQGFNKWFIVDVLLPMRASYLAMPVIATFTLVMGVGYIIGGIRSALVVGGFLLFIALTEWWDRALITSYTATVCVIVSGVIGVTVGTLSASNDRASKIVLLVCDTFQTLPSFIYLIPVIILFGITDTSVVIAMIVYATVPATRYTIEGLRSVPKDMHDAGSMSGVNRIQRLIKIEYPLAFPHIMLGLNQTLIFALFMVVIGALIGTEGLGQGILESLSNKQGIGKGLVLGFCIAFIGLAADHLIQTWATKRRKLLGID